MYKILIIQTASLGDVILSTALVETLYSAYPNAKIDVLIKKQYAQVFENHKFINKVLLLDRNKNKFTQIFSLLKSIRSNQYDAVFNIQRFFTSGFITAFSRAKIKSGFRKNPMSFLFTHKTEHSLSNNIHEIERNHALLSFLNIQLKYPKLYFDSIIESIVEKYKTEKYVCIAPASLWFTKQYPIEKWIELTDELQKNIKTYIIGDTKDYNIADIIISKSKNKNIENLCGKLKILETAKLMKSSVMNYVNDSAPLHMASAVEAPVVAIFCSTTPKFGFAPLGINSFIVETSENLDCKPCGIHGLKSCPKQHFKCGYNISTKKLVDIVKEKLKNK